MISVVEQLSIHTYHNMKTIDLTHTVLLFQSLPNVSHMLMIRFSMPILQYTVQNFGCMEYTKPMILAKGHTRGHYSAKTIFFLLRKNLHQTTVGSLGSCSKRQNIITAWLLEIESAQDSNSVLELTTF